MTILLCFFGIVGVAFGYLIGIPLFIEWFER